MHPRGHHGAVAFGSGCWHIPLDLEVKPELLRPDLGAKDGEFPTSMRDSGPEPAMSQWPKSPWRGQGHPSHKH